MTWKQIKELEKYPSAYIGNHSHSHNYLVDLKIKTDKNAQGKAPK